LEALSIACSESRTSAAPNRPIAIGTGRAAKVSRLGELLRIGYTAIIIQLDSSNLDIEEELAGQ